MVTLVNVPYVSLLEKLKSFVDLELLDKVLSVFLTYIKEDLFETRTVHHTIWGYNETLFEDYDKFRDEVGKRQYTIHWKGFGERITLFSAVIYYATKPIL